MDTNKKEFLLSVTKLVMAYGIPAAKGIISAWRVEGEPTLDQVIALRHKLPEADSFFKEDAQ